MTANSQSACGTTTVSAAVYPVLADGMLEHTTPMSGARSFTVKLPTDVTCTKCSLQVTEFMSNHPLNNPGGCWYHHCADISIQTGTGGAGGRVARAAGPARAAPRAVAARAARGGAGGWPEAAAAAVDGNVRPVRRERPVDGHGRHDRDGGQRRRHRHSGHRWGRGAAPRRARRHTTGAAGRAAARRRAAVGHRQAEAEPARTGGTGTGGSGVDAGPAGGGDSGGGCAVGEQSISLSPLS